MGIFGEVRGQIMHIKKRGRSTLGVSKAIRAGVEVSGGVVKGLEWTCRCQGEHAHRFASVIVMACI